MGVFDKVKIMTSDEVEITVNFRDETAYGAGRLFAVRGLLKEAGFKVLRIKNSRSDRYKRIRESIGPSRKDAEKIIQNKYLDIRKEPDPIKFYDLAKEYF